MILHIHSDASYLSESETKSRTGGFFYMENATEHDKKPYKRRNFDRQKGQHAMSSAAPSPQINIGYAKIFATWHFMIACRRWNEKPAAEKHVFTSNPTSQPLIVITSKCREKPLPTSDFIQLTPP
jgi:hypothetical protein